MTHLDKIHHNDKWIFTDPITKSQVEKMYWKKIKYPKYIKYKATPYDSSYDEYFTMKYGKTSFKYLYD